MKIKKGDMVEVLTGKDRGKRGEVMRAIPKADKVIVDGVNQVKKHQRATRATMQGGIIDKDMPLPVANVAIVCPNCGPTRIGYRVESTDGRQDRATKQRICRKCGGEL
ncbi:MAG: 50S ribosomal protein L24 [Actinobacteria bacterium]|nr:50S ribosomal protein L24 [Actinomycetota bacterium]